MQPTEFEQLPEAGAAPIYAVWGHSQGAHAALWTGEIAAGYAPELQLKGVAAAAPPTNLAVLVDEDTKVRRRGKKTLGDLLAGDRVLVQAKVCKADLAQGATPPLTAKRVVAHPAK